MPQSKKETNTMIDSADGCIDLDAYFRRIGYSGGREPTLETLREIHRRHAQAIPFENLNPLLGRPVRLDAAGLEEKLVHGGRGGYCFEQNLLLYHALRAVGFRTHGLAARVVWGRPPGQTAPRSHMLLHVAFEDGPRIADVGFGGLTLTGPLALDVDIVQATPHEPFRLLAHDGEFTMQARVRDEWMSLYRFDLQPQHFPDYEVSSWYLCHHPASPFTAGLMLARADDDRRYAMRNNELVIHDGSGTSDRRVLRDVGEIRRAMENLFQIRLSELPELDEALERLIRESS